MASFQATLFPSPNERKPNTEICHNSSKKRKWEEPRTEDFLEKTSKSEGRMTAGTPPIYDIELHLDTPLPLEWQRCLDIQSGQIHYYNTRAGHKTTSRDPRRSPEPPSPGHSHMSLDLDLNLTCDTQRKDQAKNHITNDNSGGSTRPTPVLADFFMDSSKQGKNMISGGRLNPPCPSWLASDRNETDQREMVATVCTKCHMLVMLCKSNPACPNCKFLHPPDQSPPKLFKQKLSLLC